MGVGGQRHAPAALPPGMTRYSLYRRLGRLQGRSGLVLKISPPPGFDPRTVRLVAYYTQYKIVAIRYIISCQCLKRSRQRTLSLLSSISPPPLAPSFVILAYRLVISALPMYTRKVNTCSTALLSHWSLLR
jgi:hypothetical protein